MLNNILALTVDSITINLAGNILEWRILLKTLG